MIIRIESKFLMVIIAKVITEGVRRASKIKGIICQKINWGPVEIPPKSIQRVLKYRKMLSEKCK